MLQGPYFSSNRTFCSQRTTSFLATAKPPTTPPVATPVVTAFFASTAFAAASKFPTTAFATLSKPNNWRTVCDYH